VYLATIVLCLYLPLWFPPGYEGPEFGRVVFPLVIASATQAALEPRAALGARWSIALAVCWSVGCLLYTPHLFFPLTYAGMKANCIALACAGALIAVIGVWRVLLNPALPWAGRSLRVAGLVMFGFGLGMAGMWPLLQVPRAIMVFLPAAVLGAAGLTVTGAFAETLAGIARPTAGAKAR
jgi:hypothetical protein